MSPARQGRIGTLANLKENSSDLLRILRSFHNDESGQDLIEYALVAALIAFGAVTAMTSLSSAINGAFSHISSQLTSAV